MNFLKSAWYALKEKMNPDFRSGGEGTWDCELHDLRDAIIKNRLEEKDPLPKAVDQGQYKRPEMKNSPF